jgi:hypothetical protein
VECEEIRYMNGLFPDPVLPYSILNSGRADMQCLMGSRSREASSLGSMNYSGPWFKRSLLESMVDAGVVRSVCFPFDKYCWSSAL